MTNLFTPAATYVYPPSYGLSQADHDLFMLVAEIIGFPPEELIQAIVQAFANAICGDAGPTISDITTIAAENVPGLRDRLKDATPEQIHEWRLTARALLRATESDVGA
jgi:hypothetical protein